MPRHPHVDHDGPTSCCYCGKCHKVCGSAYRFERRVMIASIVVLMIVIGLYATFT